MVKDNTALFSVYDDGFLHDAAEGERDLMRAVLKSAMDDMGRSGNRRRHAIEFFNYFDDSYLYSFVSICRHLGLCPYTIRYLVGLGVRRPFEYSKQVHKIAA